jgi:hypothetical protein
LDNLVGNTLNADQYLPLVKVVFDGSGTAASPQLLELMGRDLGMDSAGFNRNFAYGTLALANNTYVKLVDQSRNSTGTNAEAIYVNSLVIPAGCTLDLNGLHLYARLMQLSGTIIGGAVQKVPDSGPITVGTATPGGISAAGEVDEWTFFGWSGHSVNVVVNPGSGGSPASLPPYLNWAEVQLLDATNNVMALGSNTVSGAIVPLDNVVLPADGVYRVHVKAPASHSTSTGNYQVTVWDVTGDVTTNLFLPSFISQTTRQAVALDGNAVLKVQVSGSLPLFYQWQFEGVAIPGATNITLVLTNVQPIHSGTYRVTVANEVATVDSDPIAVVVSPGTLTLANAFAGRMIFNSLIGGGDGSSLTADKEPGEPNHAGKEGGRSVWLGWRAPVDGWGAPIRRDRDRNITGYNQSRRRDSATARKGRR